MVIDPACLTIFLFKLKILASRPDWTNQETAPFGLDKNIKFPLLNSC
jgi:hypothetical protein